MDIKNREIFKEIFATVKNLTTTLDVDILLKKISTLAEDMLLSEASAVMLLDNDQKNLSFKAAGGTKGGIIQRMKVPIGQGIAGWVAAERKSTIVNDVSKDDRFIGAQDKSSGFVTEKILCVPMMIEDELIGIIEVLNKREGVYTKDDREVLESLAALAAVSVSNAKAAEDQRNFFVNILELLVTAIEARDTKLLGHNMRVTQIATKIGKQLDISGTDYKNLYYGAMLHDIGILFTAGSQVLADTVILSGQTSKDTEQNHPSIGANMLESINLLRGATKIIRHHHENYDGTGYPDGLAGEQIPLGARIIYIAETIDEMKTDGVDDATISKMLQMGKEIHFDPTIVDLYISSLTA